MYFQTHIKSVSDNMMGFIAFYFYWHCRTNSALSKLESPPSYIIFTENNSWHSTEALRHPSTINNGAVNAGSGQ